MKTNHQIWLDSLAADGGRPMRWYFNPLGDGNWIRRTPNLDEYDEQQATSREQQRQMIGLKGLRKERRHGASR